MAFDPNHQGQSGGEPRDLEDPYRRSEDISYAIDALDATPGVDPRAIGALGICAGGGYAVYTARTDHRIKALATVVATDLGKLWRGPGFAPGGAVAALDRLADERLKEVLAGEDGRENWLPDTLEDAEQAGITEVTDIDTAEAMRYYRTPRGGNPHSTNRRLRRSDSLITGFDAFHLVEELLTQPVQVVVAGLAGNTGQLETGHELQRRAPNAEDLVVIEGARHYEMYDEPRYVDPTVEHLAAFFHKNLTA